MMTAVEADNACREQARAEGRWTDGICLLCVMSLNDQAECDICLDDAHEAWLLSREAIR